MNSFNKNFGITMNAEQYATEWQKSSLIFKKEDHYTWMASQLNGHGTTLEIGCGSGESTLAIAKNGWKILSIESNLTAIKNAESLLRKNNITVEVIENTAAQITPTQKNQVTILHKDFLDDDILSTLPLDHFDAITCWLIGSHPDHIGFHIDKKSADFTGIEMPIYRETIQRNCYLLGEKILKKNGKIHIIDRIGIPSWNEKDTIRKQFTEIQLKISGSNYKILKENCFLRRLNNGLNQSNIQYVAKKSEIAGNSVIVFASSLAIL